MMVSKDMNNKLYVVWSGVDPVISNSRYNIRRIVYDGSIWGGIQTLTNNTTSDAINPSILKNKNADYIINPVIYTDSQNTGVKLIGTIYTIPKIISATPIANESVNELDNAYIPTMNVSDDDNNTVTCRYYVDTEGTPRDTQTVANTMTPKIATFNAINMNLFTEGSHTIRFEADDGTVITQSNINIIVDKTAPALGGVTATSTDTSIITSGSATDSLSGLDTKAYRYTVGTSVSLWKSETSCTYMNLVPNTVYTVLFEARDKEGHISSNSQNIRTKAQTPALTSGGTTSNSIDLILKDANPFTTEYQISSGTKYVAQDGILTDIPSWITITGRKITITGLTSNMSYSFTAKARNAESIETVQGNSINITTIPAPYLAPVSISAKATDNSITINWSGVQSADGYDIKVDGVPTNNGANTTYTHSDLTTGSSHTYSINARIGGVSQGWSSEITITANNGKVAVLTTENYQNGKEFDLAFKSLNVRNYSLYTFTINFSQNELDVVDLCTRTPAKELTTGTISGTGITITQFSPGTITFTVNKTLSTETMSTSNVNVIRFKTKTANPSTVRYTVQ